VDYVHSHDSEFQSSANAISYKVTREGEFREYEDGELFQSSANAISYKEGTVSVCLQQEVISRFNPLRMQ